MMDGWPEPACSGEGRGTEVLLLQEGATENKESDERGGLKS